MKIVLISCFIVLLGLSITGCANFRPVVQTARYFVLTPAPHPSEPVASKHGSLGIGNVIIPGYLLQNRLVVRHGPNEIRYADNFLWAERLDKNIQRVLASDLSALLGAPTIYRTAWRRDEVVSELHVTINRFELTSNGTAYLEAKWLLTDSGADNIKRAGLSTITRPGPALSAHPEEAVATLSTALTELSREIAASITGEKVQIP